ncbi:unnamed protein product [Linum tenue]|uniref:Uncharacterized protein n=1 Tax=Linum tenue TaxID=586396 RepID=A0AAV0QXK1_9ROSI|nr:unnamed protein product [Linum tenue]
MPFRFAQFKRNNCHPPVPPQSACNSRKIDVVCCFEWLPSCCFQHDSLEFKERSAGDGWRFSMPRISICNSLDLFVKFVDEVDFFPGGGLRLLPSSVSPTEYQMLKELYRYIDIAESLRQKQSKHELKFDRFSDHKQNGRAVNDDIELNHAKDHFAHSKTWVLSNCF